MKKEKKNNKVLAEAKATQELLGVMNEATKIPKRKLLQLAKTMEWGSYGRELNKPLKWKKYADLSVPHIKNILIFCYRLDQIKKAVLLAVLMDKLVKQHKFNAYTNP